MSRSIPCLACIILLSAGCAAAGSRPSEQAAEQSTANLEAVAVAQAQECFGAFFAGEAQTFADCTLPAVVEMMGGRDQMIAFLAFARDEMASSGFEFVSLDITGEVEIHRAAEDLFAVIPVSLEMLSLEGRMRTNSVMLGVSRDGGRVWHFADGAGLNDEMARSLIPNLPADLVLPEVGAPVLVE